MGFLNKVYSHEAGYKNNLIIPINFHNTFTFLKIKFLSILEILLEFQSSYNLSNRRTGIGIYLIDIKLLLKSFKKVGNTSDSVDTHKQPIVRLLDKQEPIGRTAVHL